MGKKIPYTVYIPVEGDVVIEQAKPPFENLQTYVGGYVERVVRPLPLDWVVIALVNLGSNSLLKLAELDGVYSTKNEVVWLFNEEGKLKDLPTNPRATLLARMGYELVGDAVLLLNWDLN